MEFYLVQHGEAAREEQDPARPLTQKGRADAEKTAGFLARQGVRVAAIHHSGKLRARQTAEIFAAKLGAPLGGLAGMAPNDEPRAAADFLATVQQPVLLVGHLPHLSRLVSLLVAGDSEKPVVAFCMAGVVCLEREEGWRIKWVVRPEMV
ncbi:MAG: phosphohistidine phosphatase SixA [Candidatus Micrarchaeia archaeon]